MDKFYFSKGKILQTFQTLKGLIEGIAADGTIHEREVLALRHWLSAHDQIADRAPFDEIIAAIKIALLDNRISDGELKDIQFVCDRVLDGLIDRNPNDKTALIQRLHGVASGIAADGTLHEDEWKYLKNWIRTNSVLKGSWPFDEIESLVLKHRNLQEMTPTELEVILHYLNDFCGFNRNSSLSHPLSEPGMAITGISAVCPDITIDGKTFCFTGKSKKFELGEIADMICGRGGIFKDNMSKNVDYLVVGANGSSMWTYSSYGRKVEEAVQMRKAGHRILLVHEFDLWDHIEDAA